MDIDRFDCLSKLVDAVAASVAVIDTSDDGVGRILRHNALFREMLGLPTTSPDNSEMLTLRQALPRYARRKVMEQIVDCTDHVSPVETVLPFDLTGQTRWWRFSAQPIIDVDGKSNAVLMTCLEITDKVQLESDLEIANSRFSAVIQTAYDGIVTIDQDRRIKLFNAAAEEMFGYNADEIVGESLDRLIPECYRERHDEHVKNFAQSPIQSRQMFERGGRIFGLTAQGTEFPIEISIAKIQVGDATEFTAVIRDISVRARLIDELKRQAMVDEMTGLSNRRAFLAKATAEVALASRHGRDLSILMIDIDRFKAINDRHGHAVGDIVIQAMASAGRTAIRKSETFARVGGEEFAILLPETTEAQARHFAERLRKTVADAAFEHDWQGIDPVSFTMSVGVTEFFDGEASIDPALSRADDALYAAKAAGRNRVVVWSETTEGRAAYRQHSGQAGTVLPLKRSAG